MKTLQIKLVYFKDRTDISCILDQTKIHRAPLWIRHATLKMKSHLLKLCLYSPFKIDYKYCSRTRIDYGTGHEKTFVMFVCCLFKIGYLVDSDKTAVGLKLFAAYFDLGDFLGLYLRDMHFKELSPGGGREKLFGSQGKNE